MSDNTVHTMIQRVALAMTLLVTTLCTAEGPPFCLCELDNSRVGSGDGYGSSPAMDRDVLVIGAPTANNINGAQAGEAHVFVRNRGGSWAWLDRLEASDGVALDWFGRSIAIEGGLIVIGASSDDGRGERSGSVYIFERMKDGAWEEMQKLKASDADEFYWFGASVAIDGGRVLIGSYANDEVGFAAGAAYVFERNGDAGWVEVARLLPSDVVNTKTFGRSVDLDGDTALIGAPLDNEVAPQAGAVYFFERSGGTWVETAKVVDPKSGPVANLGGVVDLDGDQAIVGAPQGTGSSPRSGLAILYRRGELDTWEETARLVGSDLVDWSNFGTDVALQNDRVLVGAPFAFIVDGPGRLYLFERGDAGGWTEIGYDNAPGGEIDDYFGGSVLLADGFAVVGAPGAGVSRTGPGRVFEAGLEPCNTVCPGDANRDGRVDMLDILTVLVAWDGECGLADLDRSGRVDMDDLRILLAAWGPCE